METLEHSAQILFIAQSLGKVNTLSDEQTQKLISRRKVYGIREDIGLKKILK
jgi:ribulose-5-phosphate 4-epimerase/fuculose-1-phosphate aldolase